MSDFFQELTLGKKGEAPIYRLFINGEWRESGKNETFEVSNPADGKVVAHVAKATVEDASDAIEAAFLARKEMASLSAIEKSEILKKASKLLEEHQETVIDRIVLEAGKPVTDAHHEMAAAIKRLAIGGEEAKRIVGEVILGGTIAAKNKRKIGMLYRQPLGVILGITPFNYPMFIPMSKIAPALAAGNTMVIKPASDDPTPILYLAKVLQEAGLPAGAFNVVTGGGSEVGDYLVAHPKVNMITFTGSSAVGHQIAEKAVLAKLHLELGGKSPSIVSKKADLDLAVKESVKGALKFSGQRCDALSRIMVEKDIYDEFVKKAVEEVKNWKAGDPKDEKVKVGPLINENGVRKVLELVNDALEAGAKLEYGEKIKDTKSLLIKPIVLSGVTPEVRIAWEETFGPVVAIMKIDNLEEGIELANQSEYGLDSSVFTQDLDEALYASRELESGTIQVNGAPSHGLADIPFGGDEESGIGREGINLSVEEMTKLHSVVFNPKK